PNNYEFAGMRARGTDFLLASGKSGSGQNRPFVLAAGFLTDNVTNANQLFLGTNGNVGLGTNAPTERLHVSGNGLLTGNLTVSGTLNATLSGNGSGLTNLNASNVTTGTLDNARLGVVPAGNGGTGLSAAGASGNFLRSNGTSWTSSALLSSDLPAGSTNYIQTNPASHQAVTVNFTGLRTEATISDTNVIGGHSTNYVVTGVFGGTVGGGGNNRVTEDHGTVSGGRNNTAGDNAGNTFDSSYATVGGGEANTASGPAATVPGGVNNTAHGSFSFAAGQRAKANHQGSFVWSDSTTADPNFFSSTGNDQFLIKATGGVGININNPTATLHVAGTGLFTGDLTVTGALNATLSGNGSGLTNLNAGNIATGTLDSARLGLVPAGNITTGTLDSARLGVVPMDKGGTGLSAAGAADNFLRSNGTSWTSSPLTTSDIPNLSGFYIRNSTDPQSPGNFNISGNGTLSGSLTASTVNFTGLRTAANATSPNVMGGHSSNAVTAGVVGATIGGGGTGSSFSNRVTDEFGTVGGGNGNMAGDNTGNTTSRAFATVGGGLSNTASGFASTVGGGTANTASGYISTVPGGELNTALGTHSFAAGHRAKALHQGAFVWADSEGFDGSDFASTADGQFLIRAAGGVGIGTNSPGARLHVSGAGIVRARVNSDGNAGLALTLNNQPGWSVATVTGGHFQIFNDAISQNAVWVDAASNNVGVGTTPTSYKLHVNGTVAGVGPYVNASDLRYKRDIRPIGGALSKVLSLRGVTFDWRREEFPGVAFTAGRSVGFIAQEVEQVVPEAVTRDANGFRSVAYSHLTPVLVEAVREQQAHIERQQEQLKRQQTEIEQQRRQIEGLRRLVCRDHAEAEVCK
ncbi:MAG: tail fiber domain-containing protein, partial [Pyrinomonadaceae bacterium]